MKKSCFITFMVIAFMFISIGCGNTVVSNAEVLRDSEMTGGSISFEYNIFTREIYLGGEGETIQFYDADILKGWNEDGNRVGIVLKAPNEINDFDTGTLYMQGTNLTAGSFYRSVNGKKIGEIILYPLIHENENEIEIKIVWQEGVEEQVYKIIIRKGTMLMKT